MLSHNQPKVSESERDNDRGVISAEVLLLRAMSFFSERERRHKDNQQKTYDNETEEHTGGQRPIFIPDRQIWRTKTEGTDKERKCQGKVTVS